MTDYAEVTTLKRVEREAHSLCRRIAEAIRARRAKCPSDECRDLKAYCPPQEVEYLRSVLAQHHRAAVGCAHQVAGEDGGLPRCARFARVCYDHLDVATCRFYEREGAEE